MRERKVTLWLRFPHMECKSRRLSNFWAPSKNAQSLDLQRGSPFFEPLRKPRRLSIFWVRRHKVGKNKNYTTSSVYHNKVFCYYLAFVMIMSIGKKGSKLWDFIESFCNLAKLPCLILIADSGFVAFYSEINHKMCARRTKNLEFFVVVSLTIRNQSSNISGLAISCP